jgi:surface glycoprotein (TIGR04207 family)
MTRDRARAVALAAIMVVSMAAVGAGFAGSVAADGTTYEVGQGDDTDFQTIEEALNNNSLSAGDTLELVDETYSPSGQLDVTTDGIEIIGAGDTTIESESTGYGIHVTAADVRLAGFEITGSDSYAIKVDAGQIEDGRLDGFTAENIEVSDSGATGIDLNAVTNATIDSVTVTDTVSGNGLAFTDVTDTEVTGVTTSNNTWGGVAIYADGALSEQLGDDVGSYGIEFTDELNADEPLPFYEQASSADLITDIDHPTNIQYRVAANTSAQLSNGNVAGEFDWYYTSESTALDAAAATNDDTGTDAVYVSELGGPFVVDENLSIQTAVDAADDGDSIEVSEGTYNEQVIIDRANVTGLSIEAIDGPDETTITYNGTLNQPTLVVGSENITISGFSVERVTQADQSELVSQAVRAEGNNITLSNNEYTATTGGQPGDAVGLYIAARSAAPINGQLNDDPVSVTIDGGEIRGSDIGLAAESNTENFAASSVDVSVESEVAFRNNGIQVVEFGGNEAVLNATDLINGNGFDLDKGAAAGNPSDILVAGLGPFPVDTLVTSDIQDAVDNTGGNATIELTAGTYDEEVSVDVPNVTITGQGGDTVVNGSIALDAADAHLSDVRIESEVGDVFPEPGDENNAINAGGSNVTVSDVTVNLSVRSPNFSEGIAIEVTGDDASATITNATISGTGETTSDALIGVVGVSAASGADATVQNSNVDVSSEGYSFAVVSRGDGTEVTARFNTLSAIGNDEIYDGVGFGVERGANPTDQTVRFNTFDGVDTIENKAGSGELDVTGNYWTDLDSVEFLTDADTFEEAQKGGEITYDPFLTVEPDEINATPLGETKQFGHDLVIPADGDTHSVAFPAAAEGTVSDVFGENFNGTVYAYNGTNWVGNEDIADQRIGALDAFAVTIDEGESDQRITFEYADDDSEIPEMTSTELEAGWNFVGAPSNGTASDAFGVSTTEVASVVNVVGGPADKSTPYRLAGSDKINPTTVGPFQGYWVFATNDGELGAAVPVGPTQSDEETTLKGN